MPLLAVCEPEAKFKLLKELVDLHPSDNEDDSAPKQCLYDYVEYMGEESGCGNSCGDMEPLDLNATNVSSHKVVRLLALALSLKGSKIDTPKLDWKFKVFFS